MIGGDSNFKIIIGRAWHNLMDWGRCFWYGIGRWRCWICLSSRLLIIGSLIYMLVRIMWIWWIVVSFSLLLIAGWNCSSCRMCVSFFVLCIREFLAIIIINMYILWVAWGVFWRGFCVRFLIMITFFSHSLYIDCRLRWMFWCIRGCISRGVILGDRFILGRGLVR